MEVGATGADSGTTGNQPVGGGATPTVALHLQDSDRLVAKRVIETFHYTHSVPSGKSHYVKFGDALMVWSIPANKNIAAFVLWDGAKVWELARLYAPDGHQKNLLTMAIKAGIALIKRLEHPDALVSYADPNVAHLGGVYRAASWVYLGQCSESRNYIDGGGRVFPRRAFHSGKNSMTKKQIEGLGYTELKLPGKHRFAKPLSKRASSVVFRRADVLVKAK